MKAVTSIVTTAKQVFACPECGSAEHSYGHLPAGHGSFGPWYCDQCGLGVHGQFQPDGSIELTKSHDRKINTLNLLVLFEPLKNGEPVYIIVNGMQFQNAGQPLEIGEGQEYFYNSHTCPWNYLRLPVICGEDTDPHGLFQHKETVLRPTQEQYAELMGDSVHGGHIGELDANDLSFDALKKLFATLN